MANSGANTNGSQFFIVQQKDVQEDVLNILLEARDNNEEELTVTLPDDETYTLAQLFPDAVMDYYKENGGSVHLEYVFGNTHSIFGQVFEGLDTTDAIAAAQTDANDKPTEDIIIESITFEAYTAE